MFCFSGIVGVCMAFFSGTIEYIITGGQSTWAPLLSGLGGTVATLATLMIFAPSGEINIFRRLGDNKKFQDMYKDIVRQIKWYDDQESKRQLLKKFEKDEDLTGSTPSDDIRTNRLLLGFEQLDISHPPFDAPNVDWYVYLVRLSGYSKQGLLKEGRELGLNLRGHLNTSIAKEELCPENDVQLHTKH